MRVTTVILCSMAFLLAKNASRVFNSSENSLRSRRKAMSNSQILEELTSDSNEPKQINQLHRDMNSLTLIDTILEPRVIGGDEAPLHRYPYIVSLNHYGTHFCGGSLIAPDIVLSAAHCKGYATTVEVDRHDRTSTEPFTSFGVAYEIKHPKYRSRSLDNDFLIVKLKQPNLEADLPVVALHSGGNLFDVGDEVTVMGWGDTDPDPHVFKASDVLMQAQLKYMSNDECRQSSGYVHQYGQVVDYDKMVTENMMCAQDISKDTCQGDSGSPMIIRGHRNDGAEDIQIGISSWGIGCASEVFPGVYSRISSQYEWIRTMVCKHSLRPPRSFDCVSDVTQEAEAQ